MLCAGVCYDTGPWPFVLWTRLSCVRINGCVPALILKHSRSFYYFRGWVRGCVCTDFRVYNDVGVVGIQLTKYSLEVMREYGRHGEPCNWSQDSVKHACTARQRLSLASALLLPDRTRETRTVLLEFPSSRNRFPSTVLVMPKACFSKIPVSRWTTHLPITCWYTSALFEGAPNKFREISSEWSVKWLTSYLSERQISVRVGSAMSEYKTISCGVPQGSHLGPVFFIVFINNLPSTVNIPTEIYADDTTLHHEHSKLPSCPTYPALQEAIDCTEEWAESWHGKFGHAKTRILSTNKDIMLEALTPTMEGRAVTVTDNHRHLGVVLSEDLKWSKHAQCILAAASKRAGLLRLMARDLPLPVAPILYVYYVGPVLDYASPVWHGSLREEDAMSLERIQASVARSLLQADWFTPKEELFRQLGWPALRWRREITSLTMFHKLLHSRPEPLSECLFQYASATSAPSRRKPLQLLLPQTRTTRYRESFFYRSALLWNSLPHDIQSLKNSKSFRNALEKHYQSYKHTTTKKTFTYHSPLPFLSLQIECTHIPDCVTSHVTIFLQPLDGDPLDQGSSLWGILKYNKFNSIQFTLTWRIPTEGKIHCAHVQAQVLYWEQATEADFKKKKKIVPGLIWSKLSTLTDSCSLSEREI